MARDHLLGGLRGRVEEILAGHDHRTGADEVLLVEISLEVGGVLTKRRVLGFERCPVDAVFGRHLELLVGRDAAIDDLHTIGGVRGADLLELLAVPTIERLIGGHFETTHLREAEGDLAE